MATTLRVMLGEGKIQIGGRRANEAGSAYERDGLQTNTIAFYLAP